MGVMSRTKTNRQPSMGDVAAAVGVSKTTISRYLHGNFGYMSDETKARIAQVIDELGYRPNRMAQGLKATVSHMIGVTIADIGNPFSSLLLKGIQQVCRERDVQLLVSDSNNQGALERAVEKSSEAGGFVPAYAQNGLTSVTGELGACRGCQGGWRVEANDAHHH